MAPSFATPAEMVEFKNVENISSKVAGLLNNALQCPSGEDFNEIQQIFKV